MAGTIVTGDLNQLMGKCEELKDQIDAADQTFNELRLQLDGLCSINRKYEERIEQNNKCIKEHQLVIEEYTKQLMLIDIYTNRLKLKTVQSNTFTKNVDEFLNQEIAKTNLDANYDQILAEKKSLEEELQKIRKQEELIIDQLKEIQGNPGPNIH